MKLTKKLRVLIISHLFPSEEIKFAGVFISRQGQYLAKYGIECDFLVPRPWAPWPLYLLSRWRKYGPANPLSGPKELQAKLVKYIRPPGLWFRRFEHKLMYIALKSNVMRRHRKNPFDLVLGVSMFPEVEAAVIIGKKLNLPVASLAIGSDIMVYTKQLPLLWQRLVNLLKEVDLPIGVSEAICKKMTETGKGKRKPLCVYLGRDSESFSPPENKSKVRQNLGWAEGDIVAIYVGVIADFKGINELTVVAEKLFEKHHNFKLVCVGAGPSMEKLFH